MRKLEYISPSSLTIYKQDKTRYYLLYLADNKFPREPQTEPMAVGSSFDAYTKSYLHEKVIGTADPKFKFETIFEQQVQPDRRDKALIAGKHVFEEYKKSGALIDLMVELNSAVTTPRFEFDLMGQVDSQTRTLGPVPFLGKPDLFYTNKYGARVIFDWKVNGYYSVASPAQGYIRIRPGTGGHKNSMPMMFKGVTINIAQTMCMVKPDWAQQLAIYMWLCGEDVGTEDCVAAIDQVACNSKKSTPPDIRFAEHRSKISKEFQMSVFDSAQEMWKCATSGHYWPDMTLEDSQARCKALDSMLPQIDERESTSNEAWHEQVSRPY